MGNGFTFDNYSSQGLLSAIERALALFGNKEKYSKARRNAFNNVIDVVDVAKAWCREFYSVQGKGFNAPDVSSEVVVPSDFIKLSEDNSELSNINVLVGTIKNQPRLKNQQMGSHLVSMGGGSNKTFYFSGECFENKPKSILLTGSFDG